MANDNVETICDPMIQISHHLLASKMWDSNFFGLLLSIPAKIKINYKEKEL